MQPEIIGLYLAIIAIGLVLGRITPKLATSWERYSQRVDTIANAKKVRQGKLLRGGGFYPGSNRFVVWPAASIQFEQDSIIFGMPKYTLKRSYTRIATVDITRFGYVEITFKDSDLKIYFRYGQPQQLLSTLASHGVFVANVPNSKLKRADLVMFVQMAVIVWPVTFLGIILSDKLFLDKSPDHTNFLTFAIIFTVIGIAIRLYVIKEAESAEKRKA